LSLPQNLDQFATLVDIIARLRASDGCPWDRKQTHASLRENLLEECYEVLETLDKGNSDRLCDELGDLLMQVVLHTQIATKLIRRHPHIFGSLEVKDAEEVALNWEALKKKERNADASILGSVPRNIPALTYSQSMQRRVAQDGFDWEDDRDVINKLAEEVKELKQADTEGQKALEFGDLVFTLANIARREGIDLESALREANQRFYQRFTYMERVCRRRGLSLGKLPFAEQKTLWEEAKKEVEG